MKNFVLLSMLLVFSCVQNEEKSNVSLKPNNNSSSTCFNEGSALNATQSFPGEGFYTSMTNLPNTSTICSGSTILGITGDASCSNITEINDWSMRGVGQEGDSLLYTPTGVKYRFSATLNDWIRYDFYAADLVLDAKIDGDKLPSNEDPTWTHQNTPDYVSVVGGAVEIGNDGTTSTATTISIDHLGDNLDNYFVIGNISCSDFSATASYDYACAINISNGEKVLRFSLNNGSSSRFVKIVGSDFVEVGASFENSTISSSGWLEIYIKDSKVYVFHNHSKYPRNVADISDTANSAEKKYKFFDGTSHAKGTISIKETKFGRW